MTFPPRRAAIMSNMDGSARNYVLTAFLEARAAVLEDLALASESPPFSSLSRRFSSPAFTTTRHRSMNYCAVAATI
jgi:hypothetical protein